VLNIKYSSIYTKYWEILYAEYCEHIHLHKILRNPVCWTLWEDLFTQNTEEYTVCWTLWRFIPTVLNIKYFQVFYKYSHSVQPEVIPSILCNKIFLQCSTYLNTVGRFIYTTYRGIMYVWALWEDLFTQNTEEYCMLNTVGRFIYTK
jgi:hypothetical protein